MSTVACLHHTHLRNIVGVRINDLEMKRFTIESAENFFTRNLDANFDWAKYLIDPKVALTVGREISRKIFYDSVKRFVEIIFRISRGEGINKVEK